MHSPPSWLAANLVILSVSATGERSARADVALPVRAADRPPTLPARGLRIDADLALAHDASGSRTWDTANVEVLGLLTSVVEGDDCLSMHGVPFALVDAQARMVRKGLGAVLAVADTTHLPRELAGRRFDSALLDVLPVFVDPCGERGEPHTFVRDGPRMRTPIAVNVRPGSSFTRFARAELSLLDE